MFAQRQSDKTGFSENEIWVRRSFNVFETVSMTIFEHFGVRLLSRIFGKKRLNAHGFAREFLRSGMLYRPGKYLKRRGKSSNLHSKKIFLLGGGFL